MASVEPTPGPSREGDDMDIDQSERLTFDPEVLDVAKADFGLETQGKKGTTPQFAYLLLHGLMQMGIRVFPVDTTIDWNAEVFVSQIVSALLSKAGSIIAPTKLRLIIGETMTLAPVPKEYQDWLKSFRTGDDFRKIFFPHLVVFQICFKTREELLYSKPRVTSELGLPPHLEVFAHGKMVRHKAKRARPRAVGVLNHILSLKNVFEPSAREKIRPSREVRGEIIKTNLKKLKNTCIGKCQKAMIKEFSQGNFDNLGLFGATLPFIKPRTDHCFVLHPVFWNGTDFSKASYSDYFVWGFSRDRMAKFARPKGAPVGIGAEICIHMMFQTALEDMDVISWVFGHNFHMRQDWGVWKKVEDGWKVDQLAIKPNYWSRPQRGAPRSHGVAGFQQICSVPSFRGSRRSFNTKMSLEELLASVTPTATGFINEVEKEIEFFKGIEKEGTGEFYKIDDPEGKTPVQCTVGGEGRFLLQDMSQA